MSWAWRPTNACDLDELKDDINPQLKELGKNLGTTSRPGVMSGYPVASGAIVENTVVTVGATTDPTTLKSTNFGRGAFGTNGGFKFRAGGTADGAGGVKTLTLSFGGLTFATLSVAAGATTWLIEGEVWNVNDTASQRYMVKCFDGTTLETLDVSNTFSLFVETN